MIINHESEISEAGTAAEPRPSTSKSADANYLIANANFPLRVRAHRIGVWVRKVTKEAELKKGETKADLKKVEKKFEEAIEALKSRLNWEETRSAINARLRIALRGLVQCNEEFYNLYNSLQPPGQKTWTEMNSEVQTRLRATVMASKILRGRQICTPKDGGKSDGLEKIPNSN
jgi:hypothetical protein